MDTHADQQTWLSAMALGIIDLRAHFEAQLRLVAHCEEQLRKCRSTQDVTVLNERAQLLRTEMMALLQNNLAIRAVLTDMTNELEA